MKGDFSRQTFKRKKHYNSVLMQQGRVQVDADFNEQQFINLHRSKIKAFDIIGRCGVPVRMGGFKITALEDCNDLIISPGRIYVDGILCEMEPTEYGPVIDSFIADNQARILTLTFDNRVFQIGQWIEINAHGKDTQLLKITDIDQAEQILTFNEDINPELKLPGAKMRCITTYRFQPDYPCPPEIQEDVENNGRYLVYLDVWYRHITALEDPNIREIALGGPDTATRLKTIWQVKLLKVEDNANCSQFGCRWQPPGSKTTGRMAARTTQVQPSSDLCSLPPITGYSRLENQLYRVEIHKGGLSGQDQVTFKWSRDNGSVVASIKSISGKEVVVDDVGADEVLGFNNGQWVEVFDIRDELNNMPGQMIQIDTVDRAGKKIILKSLLPTPLSDEPPGVDILLNPRLRRWDTQGEIDIDTGTDAWIKLESGIEIRFNPGLYKSGDYWCIPARTSTGQIEWPVNDIMEPDMLPPHGIDHHYCPLALVDFNEGVFKKIPISDCRKKFSPLTEIDVHPKTSGTQCYTCTVGDGINSWGDFNDIQEAIDYLSDIEEQVSICILPGNHRANAVIEGRKNINIRGCENRTLIMPISDERSIFHIKDSGCITLANMDLVSLRGTAIYLEGTGYSEDTGTSKLRETEIKNNRINAFKHAIRVENGEFINIHNNNIRMLDNKNGNVAVYIKAKDSRIEKNSICVVPAENTSPERIFPGLLNRLENREDVVSENIVLEDIPLENIERLNLANPCAEPGVIYRNIPLLINYIQEIWTYELSIIPERYEFKAPGGLQIANTSERIEVIGNEITGGSWNGITLGNISTTTPSGVVIMPQTPPGFTVASPGGTVAAPIGSISAVASPPGTVAAPTGPTAASPGGTVAAPIESVSAVASPPGTFATLPESVSAMASPAETVGPSLSSPRFVAISHLEENSIKALHAEFDGYLNDLNIERNQIRNMGLNGIGVAGFFSLESIGELFSVTDITIYRNHIEGCLQQIPPVVAENMQSDMGFGGISLAYSENLVIRENCIENNGKIRPEPVSGIFILHGENIDISDNRILNNGPGPFSNLILYSGPGIRGGIVIASSFKTMAFKASEGQEGSSTGAYSTLSGISGSVEYLYDDGIPAVKIHDNIVVHPFGQSLYIMAMGPVSVVGNHFTSQGITTTNQLSRLAGTVIIVDLGINKDILVLVTPSLNTGIPNLPGAQSPPSLPSGHILFSNNQITCDLRVSEQVQGVTRQRPLSSQFIASLDDVSYESNQSECPSFLQGLFSDLMLLAVTARTNRNRFQEARYTIDFSLISYAIANMCTHNQASHNISAMGNTTFTTNEPNTVFYLRLYLSQSVFDTVKTYFQQIATDFLLGLSSTS